MASTSSKRKNPSTQETSPSPTKSKRPKITDSGSVVLNPADCDLDFNIEGDGLIGHALCEEGFAYCWSGARGNIGITGGKYCFGCKIVSVQPVKMDDTSPDQQNVCRIGISRGKDSVGKLGETEQSYGFGGTGKFSNAGKFLDYGEKFGIGDIIVCLVDLESRSSGTVEFSKNGKWLGIAKHLGVIDSPGQKLSWESALFPHVLLKNTVVVMQFSLDDGLVPEEGYKPWASAVEDGKAVRGPSFSDAADCEVIMMVGLPASGKTTWAEKWTKEHPEKRYVLLGTNLALEQMKVPGLLRKNNYGERFDRLMDRATGIFNTLLSRASKIPRNYIIDQTNVYKNARKRKLKPFACYRKKAVVIFPKPEELKVRAKKRFREMGKEVPPEAVNEMLANYVLPMSKDMRCTDEFFDEIIFPELDRVETQRHLDEMKRTLALTSGGKSKCELSPYSRESSIHSDSRMPTYSLPDPGHTYSEYSDPSVRVDAVPPGGSWICPPVPAAVQPFSINANTGPARSGQQGKVEPVQPYPTNVNTGYRGLGQLPRVESFTDSYEGSLNRMLPRHAYEGTLNRMPSRDAYGGSLNRMPSRDAYYGAYSSYASPLSEENSMRYGSYAQDFARRHDAPYSYGTTDYMNHGARAAYQPPHGSSYGTPTSRSHTGVPSRVQHPEPEPFGGYPHRYY